jgi:hypothetical protein
MTWQRTDDGARDGWLLTGGYVFVSDDEVQELLEAVRDHRLEQLGLTIAAADELVHSLLKVDQGPTAEEGAAAAIRRAHGRCEGRVAERCTGTDEVTHHKRGRVGPLANHPDHLARLCDPCHRWVHDHVLLARELGLLLSRTARVEPCTTCRRPVELGADAHEHDDSAPYCAEHCPTCNPTTT